MLGPDLVDPGTGQTFRRQVMADLVKDWTGGCAANPGNNDILFVLFQAGIIDRRNAVTLARRLRDLDELALATVIHEFLTQRRVRVRLVRHALKFHGVSRQKGKADLKELEAETAEIMRKGGLSPWGES